MLKKKWVLLVLSAILLTGILAPSTGQASELGKINDQLKDLKEQMRAAEKKQQQAESTIQETTVKKVNTEKDLAQITEQIDIKVNEMAKVSSDIDQAEFDLEENGRQLEAANKRIAEREKLLDARVQLMYTDGSVSYLDVLLSATSFSDFLDRLDSIEQIANRDKELVAEHKRDKELVLEKKKQIEADLVRVRTLYVKLEDTKQELMIQEKEKEVMIASFDKQIEESHSLSDEQEALLVDLVSKRASLEQQKVAEEERQRQLEEERRQRERENQKSQGGGGGGSSSSNTVYGYSGGQLSVPLKSSYTITSLYGTRRDPITGQQGAYHSGIDMAAPAGTSIYAAESGVVVLAEWWSGYGNCVIIDHGQGLWTLYGHIRSGGIKVEKGQKVKVGDKIAEVGSTGRSTGNHLHFEVRLNGERTDPEPYLQ
ncbi:murein hydrolase activator EnvC family protein [Paenibacillus aquistagni]|uniref:Murein DD-endopeptidase MepM and murein hydrolase activator NlpD, contain LysM domain n=1 Tax=Paenibacillus aquistagni TaxID=1852522 RepID=A0A1X7KYL6_9BACL|nr:peptidoglycan DD-metalloendopeptidase family protein [Paenibacillus aquistagni]SMG46447.1 Murein DD-endopeptidase MepM and murein hydrolase activator NlpD, contain LysM domain [Paenibacillus aquistagni]